jgi:hypothetical protein
MSSKKMVIRLNYSKKPVVRKRKVVLKGVELPLQLVVLAIGLALKLVGDVDFLSVVGLGLSIVLISVAFERVKIKISSSEAINTIKVMVAMAAAITMSSWILQFITPYLLHKQQLQY